MADRIHRLDDGTMWPTGLESDPEKCGLEWQLRYAPDTLDTRDHLMLASIVAAYRALLYDLPANRVNIVRAALQLHKEGLR